MIKLITAAEFAIYLSEKSINMKVYKYSQLDFERVYPTLISDYQALREGHLISGASL